MTLVFRDKGLRRLSYSFYSKFILQSFYNQRLIHQPTSAKVMTQRGRDTHFLCFPLVNVESIPQLALSLAHFRDVTTARSPSNHQANGGPGSSDRLRIIPEKAHRPPGTFHLTLGVMNLSEANTMDRAVDLLLSLNYSNILRDVERDMNEDAISQGLDHETSLIRVDLKGLSAFSSPSHARVFYAHPHDETERLYKFALAIRQRFADSGFITETRPLVLHATVANMSYVRSSGGNRGRGRNRGRIDTLDGNEVVRVFNEGISEYSEEDSQREYVWAQNIVIDRVRLCKMGAEKSENEIWGLEYRPIVEKLILDDR